MATPKNLEEKSISKFINSNINWFDQFIFVFPYSGKLSEKMKNGILKLFNKH